MPINRILTSQEDFYIAIRQLDDEINNLRTQLATIQAQVKNGVKNGSGSTTPTPPAQKVTFAGDLTGDINSQTVIGIQGDPISSVPPATNQVLEWNGSTWIPTNLPTIPAAQVNSDWNASSGVAMILNKPTIPSAITFAGDLSGTSTSQTVVGLRGKNISSTAPVTNQLLSFDGTNWTPSSNITIPGTLNVSGQTTLGAGGLIVSGNTQLNGTSFTCAANPAVFNGTITATNGANIGPLTCSTLSASNTATFTNGLNVYNSKTIGFYDATNTYIAHQLSVGSGNAWNLSSSTTGNAGSYVATIQATNTGAITLLGNPFKINSPDATRNLTITVANGADPSITSSTAILNISGTTPRMLAGSSIQFWNPANNGFGSIYSDANYLWVNPPSGQSVVLGQQVWNGGVNANTYSLGNLSGCALTSGRLSTTGNSTDFVMFNTGSTKYLQFIPADGSQGANPYIFSSTGILVTNAGINLPYATFTTPASINFGSNWQTWTPTLTANAGTLTPTAWYYNYYIRIGPLVFFSIRFAFNASAAFGYFYVTMPITGFTPLNNYMGVGSCICESGPLTLENLLMRWELSDHVVIQRAGGAQFALGNSYVICMNGFYRCA